MRDLDMPQTWKDEVEKAADFDIRAYCAAVKDITENNNGHYGEEYILANYKELARTHDKMTLYMIRLFEKLDRRAVFNQQIAAE